MLICLIEGRKTPLLFLSLSLFFSFFLSPPFGSATDKAQKIIWHRCPFALQQMTQISLDDRKSIIVLCDLCRKIHVIYFFPIIRTYWFILFFLTTKYLLFKCLLQLTRQKSKLLLVVPCYILFWLSRFIIRITWNIYTT
jgi:hypothetical protein